MKYLSLTAVILLGLATASGHAYETTTHAYMTAEAVERSVLADRSTTSVWVRFGFDRLDDVRPFHSPISAVPIDLDARDVSGESYYDLVPQGSSYQPTSRDPFSPFERDQISVLFHENRLTGAQQLGSFVFLAKGWISRGAIREDDLKSGATDGYDDDPSGNMYRVFNHFYDPVNNHGFAAIAGADAACLLPNQSCERTIDWATGLTDALASPAQLAPQYRNHFSWESAREAEFRALTTETIPPGPSSYALFREADSEFRATSWATMFRALGDCVHLLQDMAQPQHTRQDIHPPTPPWLGGDFLNRQIFEAYTDYRVTHDSRDSNPQKSILRSLTGAFPTNDFLRPPSLGSYPTIAFSSARKYFSSQAANPSGTPSDAEILSRRGLADYSNRGFFTAGTLPASSAFPYTLPPSDVTDPGYLEQPSQGSLWINQNQVKYTQLTRAVPDTVAPSYVDPITTQYSGKVPLATTGIWKVYSQMNQIPATTSVLDLYNYQVMADVLIPRAVAYSTGLINYFFRGKLAVEAPTDGLFSVTDQAISHGLDLDGYPRCNTSVPGNAGEPPLCTANGIFGFTKVRLNVRNDTSPITESNTSGPAILQNLSDTVANPSAPTDARLVAVARYHRNLCYQRNLGGETVVNYLGVLTTPSCPDGARSVYQEISVSVPAVATASALNNTTTSTPITFDFSADPIPINATDLVIQVVYRGPVGEEVDGIALGTIDVREPTYLTLWNNTDYAGCNGQWVTNPLPAGCTSIGTTQRDIGTARLCIGTQLLYTRLSNGGNGNIQLGHYVRLAALLDNQTHSTRARLIVGTAGTELQILNKTIVGQQRQGTKEFVTALAPYIPDPMFMKRGIIGSVRPIPWYEIIGTDPQPGGDTGTNDVGSLLPSFSASQLPDTGGQLSFPNTSAASPGCTSASKDPIFDDEIEASTPPT